MDEAGLKSYEVVISGKVQGVFFRAFTLAAAKELGGKGWVRNEPDGSVLALLQGHDDQVLQRMLLRLREGSPAADVRGFEVRAVDDPEVYETFRILR